MGSSLFCLCLHNKIPSVWVLHWGPGLLEASWCLGKEPGAVEGAPARACGQEKVPFTMRCEFGVGTQSFQKSFVEELRNPWKASGV